MTNLNNKLKSMLAEQREAVRVHCYELALSIVRNTIEKIGEEIKSLTTEVEVIKARTTMYEIQCESLMAKYIIDVLKNEGFNVFNYNDNRTVVSFKIS